MRPLWRVGGAYVSVLLDMPPQPLVGAKQAEAGLAEVPLPRTEIIYINQQRAARALVAILPRNCASFVLHAIPKRR